MKEKFNPKEYIKNKEQTFTKEIVNDTLKYQELYGFEIGNNNVAWNNESDAFRHAYMQAILSQRYNNIAAKLAGNRHEKQGNKRGQDPRESNMDLWNNEQGRQIADEIRKEYPNFKSIPEDQQKNIIAQKVVQRMQSGQLITGLDDKRQFKEQQMFNLPFIPTRGVGGIQNNGIPLGFAADININQLAQQMELQSLNIQRSQQQEQSNLSGYTNPLTGNNRIYTREEVGAMSSEEFAKYEKEIDAQTKAFNGTMPTNGDLHREAMIEGGVIYVNSYTRSDGTKVKGYYRSQQRF